MFDRQVTPIKRISAFIIDYLILYPFSLSLFWFEYQGKSQYIVTIITLTVMPLIYFPLFHYFKSQTPGKMIFKIKVVSNDDSPINLKQSFVRDSVIILLVLMKLFVTIQILEVTTIEVPFSATDAGAVITNSNKGIINYLDLIWYVFDLMVLLYTVRARALHDYIANTKVIKC